MYYGTGDTARLVGNGNGIQQDWYTMELGRNETGAHWNGDTATLVGNGTGIQQDWYAMELGHNGTGAQ